MFLVLINDLEINNAGNIWNYVDDTTTSEIAVKGASSNSQLIADTVVQWSFENRVKLNSEKCKELRISFAKNKPQLVPMVVKNQELECVEIAKLLGVTMSNNLTWNMHIDQIIKKASKRMYLLIQLKRANVARHELILFLYILYKVSHDLRIACVFLRPAIVFKERSRECREMGTINHLPGTGL